MAGVEQQQPTEPRYAGDDQFRILVESVLDYAIFLMDAEGRVVTWNLGAEKLKGYTPGEIIGSHYSLFFPASDRNTGKPQRALDTARREGRFEEEGWRVRKDGSRFWASALLTALHKPDGSVAGFSKVTRDLTDKRLAEEALHQSEQRFRLLVESVRDYAIFMLSTDGRIISWNAGAQKIKGYTAEEVLGRHFSIFYPVEDTQRGKTNTELETAIAEGRYEEEGWRVRKDGKRFWANVIITPVRDQLGNLIGFAKVTRDLTERRRAREELITSQQQARELTLANAAKEEFLGIVAHELRNPITVLYGSARFLQAHCGAIEESVREELIETLAEESDKLRQLVENLLALARPPTPESLRLVEASLQERLASGVAAFERASPRREVNISGPVDLIPVAVEPTYFERILLNLLENADKYSGRDKAIDVVVSVRANHAIIEVMDRGPGVDPAELSLIFESFYRSPRTAEGVNGKGLGLAVCRRLIASMNCDIEAVSRVGGGLILRVSLPLAEPCDEDELEDQA